MEVIFFVVGTIVGIITTSMFLKKEPIGTIRVDNSDPDSQPYLFLELYNGKWNRLQQDKFITLKVDLSQK